MFRLQFYFYMTILPMCTAMSEEWAGFTPLNVNATFPSATSLVLPIIFLKLSNLAIGRPLLWGTEAVGMLYYREAVDNSSAVQYDLSNVSSLNLAYLLTNMFSQVPNYIAAINYNLARDDWFRRTTIGTVDEAIVSYLQAPIYYLGAPTYTHTASTTQLDAV
jgi:hypothetical protein